jgi:SAM-dependent methyltransferase
MEGVVLTPLTPLTAVTGKARGVARRVRTARDRIMLPEATSGTEQWQRVPLNAAVNAHLDALDPGTLSAAEISGDAYKDKGWAHFDSLDYPAFDLCAPLDGHRTYDVVLCEQVMEHVVDPIAAAANLRDLCNPGGHVVVSTPFLIRVHELPAYGMRDYWRFTPSGLRLLLERAGLEVQEIGHWGNRRVVRGNLDRWPAYRRWHALGNEPDLPVQVWAFARRP